MAYKVFVSSTYEDLIDYRAAVSLHLRKAGYHPHEMETMAARNEKPLEVCMQEVAKADLFVGIYAWRYGFAPAGWEESITELELNEAQWLYKPIFCFLVDENLDSPAPREEEEKARKLKELKRKIREDYGTTLDKEPFRTPEGLALSVLAALGRWKDRQIPANLSRERIHQLNLGAKVERFWVEDVLRRKVPAGRALRISRETSSKAVGRQPSEESLPGGPAGRAVEPLYSFFRRQGRSLLILGPQGAGKTVALIDLVRGLVPLAIRDPNAPIPVLFNLASWKWQDLTSKERQDLTPRERQERTLTAWMADELSKHYQAGKKEPTEWIDGHWILPLLDGLDEVGEDCRQSCVEAINAHLEEHGVATGMAVACRTRVYQKLPNKLRLESAVALQPLSPAQIEEYLATVSPPPDRLRAAIQRDAGLRKLVSSPLMLTIIEKGAQSTAPEDPLTGQGSDQAFKHYIARALEPERERKRELPWPSETGELPLTLRERPYPSEKARRILAWLAHGMAEHSLALFQIERLQPSWLTTRGQIFTYSVLSHVLGGTLLTLPLAVVFTRMDFVSRMGFVAAGLAAGTLIGALDIPRLLRKGPPASPAAASLGRAFARTLFLGGLACALLLLIALYGLRLISDQTLSNALLESILLVGAVCGGVFGSRGAMRTGSHDIRVAEALVWKGWSRKWALFGAVSLLLGSLTCWAIADLFSRAGIQDHSNGADFWLPFSLIVAVLGGALSGAFGGLGGKTLGKDAPPNWGTWLSLRNAGVAGLVTGLAATLVLAFVLGSLEVAGSVMPQGTLPWLPLQVGAVLGFWAGLAYSGLDFVQHFSLRLVLRLWRLVPGRLVDFLEYAVERELLDRPGGSYQFYHPQLRDHFAKSYGSELDRID